MPCSNLKHCKGYPSCYCYHPPDWKPSVTQAPYRNKLRKSRNSNDEAVENSQVTHSLAKFDNDNESLEEINLAIALIESKAEICQFCKETFENSNQIQLHQASSCPAIENSESSEEEEEYIEEKEGEESEGGKQDNREEEEQDYEDENYGWDIEIEGDDENDLDSTITEDDEEVRENNREILSSSPLPEVPNCPATPSIENVLNDSHDTNNDAEDIATHKESLDNDLADQMFLTPAESVSQPQLTCCAITMDNEEKQLADHLKPSKANQLEENKQIHHKLPESPDDSINEEFLTPAESIQHPQPTYSAKTDELEENEENTQNGETNKTDPQIDNKRSEGETEDDQQTAMEQELNTKPDTQLEADLTETETVRQSEAENPTKTEGIPEIEVNQIGTVESPSSPHNTKRARSRQLPLKFREECIPEAKTKGKPPQVANDEGGAEKL